MEEVRRAQELADTGDPRFDWQQDREPGDPGRTEPSRQSEEIFAQFLEERLGWEAFLWDEAFAHLAIMPPATSSMSDALLTGPTPGTPMTPTGAGRRWTSTATRP